jgi:O-antigen ligase
MDREKIDRWCEKGILGLILGILIFAPLDFGAVRPLDFLVIQAVTVAILVLWILRFWISPRPVFFWPPICWAVLVFVAYAIFRYATAPVEYAARMELIRVFTYAFLFVAIVNNLARQEFAQATAVVLVILAFALSIFSIYQFFSHDPVVWTMVKPEGYVMRGSGTFMNPNNFAGFLEMILPLGLALTLLSRLSHATRIALFYASLVIVIGMGSTLSRGGWLATGLMLVAFLITLLFQREFRLRSTIILAILLLLGIGIVARTYQSKRRFEQLVEAGSKKDDRLKYWKSAIEIWKENIWLGAGPAHYDIRYRQYRPANLQDRPEFVHNDYLNTLADWGIAGLTIIVAFLVIFYISVFKMWRFVRRTSNDFGAKFSNKAAFVFGGAFGVLAIVFHSALDFNMHIPANAILALTLIALVTTYARFATESYWSSLGVARKFIFTIIGLAGIFYLVEQGIRSEREQVLLARAAQLNDVSDEKLQALKNAFAIEPKNFEIAYDIGELIRSRAFLGNSGYELVTQKAMEWFQRSIQLNPFFPFSYIGNGMCLDWLGKNSDAEKYFSQAKKLDPNGYYTTAYEGWHQFQMENYAEAKKLFERSEKLMPNSFAESYLEIIEQKMSEKPAP